MKVQTVTWFATCQVVNLITPAHRLTHWTCLPPMTKPPMSMVLPKTQMRSTSTFRALLILPSTTKGMFYQLLVTFYLSQRCTPGIREYCERRQGFVKQSTLSISIYWKTDILTSISQGPEKINERWLQKKLKRRRRKERPPTLAGAKGMLPPQ